MYFFLLSRESASFGGGLLGLEAHGDLRFGSALVHGWWDVCPPACQLSAFEEGQPDLRV